MATKRRTLPVRSLDARVLLGDIAVDAANAYVTGFAFDEGPRLVAIAHGATSPHLAVNARASAPLERLVCDDTLLVASTSRRLVRVDTRTGALRTLVETPAAMTRALALDEEFVYGSVVGEGGGVFRAPRSGGALEWVHRGMTVALAVSRGRIAFGDTSRIWIMDSAAAEARPLADATNPHAIAFVGDELVWTEFADDGSLCAADLARGGRRVVARSPYSSGLVASGEHLYWAQSSLRKANPWLWRVRRGDPATVEPLLRGGCKFARLAGYGATLAWCGTAEGGAHALDVGAL